jgi:hypothetical protein
MLQSLLASGERVGQEKAYTVVVVVGEIARLGTVIFETGFTPKHSVGRIVTTLS